MTHRPTFAARILTPALAVALISTALIGCSSGTRVSQQRTHAFNPTEVFPATFSSYSGRSGMTTSPQFSMYGELPNVGAGGHASSLPFEAVENMRQISFTAIGSDFNPVVSRDGKWVYYASTQHKPTADLYVKSVDGSSIVQLTSDPAHDVMPALSPDGKRIAFASNRAGSWDIYVMNADGGQAVQITNDSSQELHPTWSHDGKSIAFCRLGETSDRWEIWVTEVDRPSVRRFVTFGLFPDWHPTRNRIMFQRSRERGDRFFSVWMADLEDGEGSNITELASSPVAAVINPSWSHDGEWISFATVFNPPDETSGARPQYADVWIMKADGTARANLTGGRFVNLMPTWGPDHTVYFISDRTGHDNVWAVTARQAVVAATGGQSPASDFANVPTRE